MELRVGVLAVLLMFATGCMEEPVDVADAPLTQWRSWGEDPGGERYSELTQIDPTNVDRLEVAWTFHTGESGEGFASQDHRTFQTTPLMIDGLLYLSTAYGKVIALDPETGVERWRYESIVDPELDYGHAIASRGVSYWEASPSSNAQCARRILFGTIAGKLTALDARSGRPCLGFGHEGIVDLTENVGLMAPGNVGTTSAPVVYHNLVIVGTSVADYRGPDVESGIVRAFDIESGREVWSWNPVPENDEDPAWSTWGDGSAARAGASNAWAPLSADIDRGLVFIPTSTPGSSFYGGHRPGNNEYSSSIVALDAATGSMVWHRQLVHHDLWDYDTPAQPVLTELRRDGRPVPVVVQATKMGLLFIFNRETGEPFFPIEERPVPQGGVNGEYLSPTQPFPVLPPSLSLHDPVRADDAWGFTFWDRGRCRKLIARYRSEGIYTPPSVQGTIITPGWAGGMNWGSITMQSGMGRAIVNTMDMPMVARLIPNEDVPSVIESGEILESELIPQVGTPYHLQISFLLSPLGAPCTKPPWGTLSSVDLNDGRILWQVPLGTVQDLAPAPFPNIRYGVPNIGGSIVTASGLAFIGAAVDNYLRAFDVESGDELWKGRLPASGQATPMTYAIGGTQFVVIAAGGHGSLGSRLGDSVVAFALPRK